MTLPRITTDTVCQATQPGAETCFKQPASGQGLCNKNVQVCTWSMGSLTHFLQHIDNIGYTDNPIVIGVGTAVDIIRFSTNHYL